jgi:hypothetical protein
MFNQNPMKLNHLDQVFYGPKPIINCNLCNRQELMQSSPPSRSRVKPGPEAESGGRPNCRQNQEAFTSDNQPKRRQRLI